MLAMELPSRTDGVTALLVRRTGTAVVVDVDQARGKDLPGAVENIHPLRGEVAPAAAGPRREHATLSEGDERIDAIDT